MGVILQGILGSVSGKVGPVVGAVWHGIPYLKGYVIPSNPQSAAQIAQRDKMSNAVLVAQEFIADLIPALWNPVAVKMSGYNYFVQQNISTISATQQMDEDCVSSKGTLEGTAILTATYTTGSGVVSITYDGTATGNGLDTDKVYMTCWDAGAQVGYAGDSTDTRVDAAATLTIATGLNPASVRVWISFNRGSGSEFKVSNSTNLICSAP